ncbi:FKBP-type peptidyl-prolyl cis-trans isomerase [Mucilaginibacter arboris]|uniref:Peptidyl-prolyl cis-trans isomerase n=1 Tax=Mucilaginibacter arboris TaxID=2682090 RepID=A0A7K1SS00_9SPHI|nr:FKBP-type peptidyl-prolyl cis-trans isomerase [Mucilaginibacter arboris]MVN20092.1 peptidylprolyl isomerase [Mucilaginibacter arboris]
MKKYLLFFALFTLIFSACKKSSTATVDPAVQAKIDDDKIQAYIKAKNITAVKDPSGLYYQILIPGSGTAPTLKSTITVAYTGTLLDGTQFDSSMNFTSLLGGNLIQGWKIGIPYDQPGGRILLLIPSALGYGNSAAGTIPANSVLVFTIDLRAVQG